MRFSLALASVAALVAAQCNEECPEYGWDDHLDTPEYQALSACCKEEIIWINSIIDRSPERFFVGNEFKGFFNMDFNLSFDVVSDSMPVGRIKRTHPRGTMTKVEFIAADDSPYTGCWRGFSHGVMRISETTATTPEAPKTSPGYGVKCLRDGMSSGNFFGMFAFDGQPSFNFFKNRWTTILQEANNMCARETVMKSLNSSTNHVGGTSVMELSQYDQYGNKEQQPNWPFIVDSEPYDVYGWTDHYQNDFHEQLALIPENTAMFKLFGYDTPPEHGGEEVFMGWLVSRSETTSSLWGDQRLFFQHKRMEDDIKERPHYFEWLQFFDGGRMTETPLIDPAPRQKCPFMFLFEEAGIL